MDHKHRYGALMITNKKTEKMSKLEYVLELSMIIEIDGKVNLTKLEKIIDLNNKFYNTKIIER